jgi:hypothetical protein
MDVKLKLLMEGNKMHIRTWLRIFSPKKDEMTGGIRTA